MMKKIEELARRLYEAYGDVQQWEGSGKHGLMPAFSDLSVEKRRRWILLALDACRIGLVEGED